jgi:hypothetical protein
MDRPGLSERSVSRFNQRMDKPAMATEPAGLIPYSPDWLNVLSDAERQSMPMQNFSRSLHDDGGAHVAWLLWSVQAKTLPTPLEYRQGSVFFLDCGHPSRSLQATCLSNFRKTAPSAARSQPSGKK